MAEKQYLLSIYIFCFENAENVARILDSLKPFESVETEVIVADNSESERVQDVVLNRQQLFNGHLRYVRHAFNLGGVGSLMRSFELAAAKYLWVVGANDVFLPKAVQKVEDVLNCDDAGFFFFPVNGMKQGGWPGGESTYTTFRDALKDLELGPLASTNSTVYRLSSTRQSVPFGYEGLSSLIPHVAIMAHGISEKNPMRFVPEQVVQRLPRPRRWDPRKLWANLSLIYPNPEDWSEWLVVRNLLLKSHGSWTVGGMEREGLPVTTKVVMSTLGQFGPRAIPLVIRMLRLLVRQLVTGLFRRGHGPQHFPERHI